LVNPHSTTTTIQSSNVSPQINVIDNHRVIKSPTQVMTFENIVKIDNQESRKDSKERIIQVGSSNPHNNTTTVRQSSKSPDERKITITYDTTKRVLNNTNSGKTVSKPNTGNPM
jgi:hypothetical protein